MWLIPPDLQAPIFLAVVAIVTIVVRRKVGWGWLFVVWLGLSALATGSYIVWVYRISPLSPDETRIYAWAVARATFLLFLLLSGSVVWLVAIIVPPRTAPADASSTEPPQRSEDTHELFDLPQRYRVLLLMHREARQQAGGRPWYRAMFRGYVPSYIREDVVSTFQFWRAPDDFMRDFVAAAPVFTALSEMPTAHLSALEAYPRVNLRRMRRHLRPVRWIAGVFPAIIIAASRVLPSGTLSLEKWHAVQASITAFATQAQYQPLISYLIGTVLGLVAGYIIVRWLQHRLEVFGELVTVALAQRRLEAFGDTDT
jgi:hypothetical protein